MSHLPFDLHHPKAQELVRSLLAEGLSLRVRVTGASMLPLLKGGELLLVEPVPARVRIGDLLVFVGPGGRLVVHRLVRRLGRGRAMRLQMQGDGCPKPDDPVPPEAVLGRVARIEFGGAAAGWRESRPAALWRAQQSLWRYRWRYRIR